MKPAAVQASPPGIEQSVSGTRHKLGTAVCKCRSKTQNVLLWRQKKCSNFKENPPRTSPLCSRCQDAAWVAFKLDSADWYVARVQELFGVVARIEHQVGVEGTRWRTGIAVFCR